MAYAVLLDRPEEGVNISLERTEKYNDPYGKAEGVHAHGNFNGQEEHNIFGRTIKYSVLKEEKHQ